MSTFAGTSYARRSAYNDSASATELAQLQQLTTNTKLLLETNPWLSQAPDSLMTLAGSGMDPVMMMDNNAAMAGLQHMDQVATALQSLSPVAQSASYSKMTEQQQRALAQLGYALPDQPEDKSPFESIMGGIADVAAPVVGLAAKPLAATIGPALGKAFDALTWIGDVPGHFYRVIRQMESWQQWVALGVAVGSLALAPATLGASAALGLGTLSSLGVVGGVALGAATASTALTSVTDLGEWWDVMKNKDGERIFTKGAKSKAQTILGNADHLDSMARNIAANMDLEDLAEEFAGVGDATNINVLTASIERVALTMAETGTPEYEAVYAGLATLIEQPEFRQAVDTLQNGKISFGRDVAQAFGMQPGDTGYNIVSGGMDAAWLVALDPMLLAGTAGKLMRITRRGVNVALEADGMARIAEIVAKDDAVGAVFDQVAKAMATDNFAALPKQWHSMHEGMRQWAVAGRAQGRNIEWTRDEVLKFIGEGDGMKAILEGKATITGLEAVVLSKNTPSAGWGKYVNELRQFRDGVSDTTMYARAEELAKKFGVTDELSVAVPSDYFEQQVGMLWAHREMGASYRAGEAVGKKLVLVPGGKSVSEFMTSITTMIPPSKSLRLVGEGSESDIPRFVETFGREFNVPSYARDEWLNMIMHQGTIAERRAVVTSFMDSSMRASGMHSTDKLKMISDEFIGKFNQAYGSGGLDLGAGGVLGDIRQKMGLYPDAHQAIEFVVPQMREMARAIRNGSILRNVARVTDADFAEQALSRFWKPSVLLRIGFIPRAAGEEMLAFFMRVGEGSLIQEMAAQSVGKGELYHEAVELLAEAGGDISKLSTEARAALKMQYPTHLRPLVAMGERTGWKPFSEQTLDGHVTWMRRQMADGMGWDFVDNIPDWAKPLIMGREHSWRNMVANGVDRDLVEASKKWTVRHADPIMKATSSLNASKAEKRVVNPDQAVLLKYDPLNPQVRIETPVVMRGERGFVDANHPLYLSGTAHRMSEWRGDEILNDLLPRHAAYLLPENRVLLNQPQVAKAIDLSRNVQTRAGRKIFNDLLVPDTETMRQTAWALEHKLNEPELAAAYRAAIKSGDVSVTSVAQRIDDEAAVIEMERVKLIAAGPADTRTLGELDAEMEALDKKVKELRRYSGELRATQELMAGMEVLTPKERHWMSQAISHDMSQPGGGAYSGQQLRAMYREGDADLVVDHRPTNVLSRGMRDPRLARENADGSLTLLAQGQEQHSLGAISTTMEQGEAAWFSTLGSIDQNGNALDAGFVVEFDADVAFSQFNTTMDQVETIARADVTEGAGVYRRSTSSDNELATEFAFVPENGELTIPAGKWRIIDSDSSRAALADWTQRYDADMPLVTEILGLPVESVLPRLSTEIDDFLAGMDPQLADELRAGLLEDLGAWADYYESRGMSLDEAIESPGDVISEVFRDRENLGDVGIMITDFLDREIDGQKIGDLLQEVSQFDRNRGAPLTDLLRERLGMTTQVEHDDWVYEGILAGDFKSQLNQILSGGVHRRGTGGYAETLSMGGMSPFYEDLDAMKQGMVNDLTAMLMRPENQTRVAGAGWMKTTADGRTVAKPIDSALARTYVPLVPDDITPVRNAIETARLGGGDREDVMLEAAQRLLDNVGQSRINNDIVDALTPDQQQLIIAGVLDKISASRKYDQPITMALDGVAFDDPRVARWVSSVIAGNSVENSVAVQRVGALDMPRTAITSGGQDVNGVRLDGDFGRAGKRYITDQRYEPQVMMMDNDHLVNMADGSVMPGVSPETATKLYAESIVEEAINRLRVGERQYMRPRDAGDGRTYVGRKVGDKAEELEVGEKVEGLHDLHLLDEEGNVLGPVEWGDPRYFEAETQHTGTDLMWEAFAPMLRDANEDVSGLATRVPFELAQDLDKSTQLVSDVPDLDQEVFVRRFRTSSLGDVEGGALPNVSITETYKELPNTAWDRTVRYGFDKIIGPMIDSMARKPMSFHYFASAYKQNKQALTWMLDAGLFDNVNVEFAEVLTAMTGAGTLEASQAADARLVAKTMYGVDLDGASDDAVKAWLISLSKDNLAYRANMGETARAARAAAATEAAQGIPASWAGGDVAELVEQVIDQQVSWRISEAADRLVGVSPDALAMTANVTGVDGMSPAHQLVAAYNDAVPAEIWDEGHDAVVAFLTEKVPDMPHSFTPEQWRLLKAARQNMAHTLDTIEETAALRAIWNVEPFLDSHEQRTIFAELGRNMLPFWYAEENFLKRWARTLHTGGAFGLDTLRKAQLAYMGIKSAGIVRTDVNGKDWFVYPGSGLLIEAVGKIPGVGDTAPMGVLFAASTDSILPGINENIGSASPSPFVAIPTDLVLRLFPDSTDVRRALLGDITATNGAITQLIPTTVRRAWDAVYSDEESSSRYASAMLSAIAFSEASDQGLPEGATPAQMEEYLDRMRNHARIIMISQALSGFVSPGSPVAMSSGANKGLDSLSWLTGVGIEDPREVTNAMYREYVGNLGVDAGTQAFLAAMPSADLEDITSPEAFTTSMSSSASAAPLPATRTGLKWYTDHQKWVDSSPEAGAWFLPPDQDGEVFDFYSYSQQLANGLRKQRTPGEFLTAIKYRQGADVYFTQREKYEDTAIQLANDQDTKRQLDEAWDLWKSTFFAAHPIFAEEIQAGDGRQRRERTIEQMRYAVNDPNAPASPNTEGIRQMVNAFDKYKAMYALLGQSRDAVSVEKLRNLKSGFEDWVTAWTIRNPSLERMWSSVYKPESGLS